MRCAKQASARRRLVSCDARRIVSQPRLDRRFRLCAVYVRLPSCSRRRSPCPTHRSHSAARRKVRRARRRSIRSAFSSSVPLRADAFRRSPACRAIIACGMSARRRAAFGSRSTAARPSGRCSTRCPRRRSARSPSRPPSPARCGRGRAKHGRFATPISWATASTNRPTPARPGRTWGFARRGAFRE